MKIVFDSKYLKANDLNGQDRKVTIANTTKEKVGDDDKYCAYFAGISKALVLNKTNANMIIDTYGNDSEAWIGSTWRVLCGA